jgi:hypothetical protein
MYSAQYAKCSYAPDNPEWRGYHARETPGNTRTHAAVGGRVPVGPAVAAGRK